MKRAIALLPTAVFVLLVIYGYIKSFLFQSSGGNYLFIGYTGIMVYIPIVIIADWIRFQVNGSTNFSRFGKISWYYMGILWFGSSILLAITMVIFGRAAN